MAGMLRLKDEGALAELLKKGNLREATMITGKAPTLVKAPAKREPAPPGPKVGSDIEELLAQQIRLVGNLPEPIREYHHLRGSKHRLDFAWPEYRVNGMQLGVEVQGMVHRIKHNFSGDIEKRARGQLQGWLVLEVGGEQIRSGKAMEWLQELFKRATKEG
jgi:hypothetical protein